METTSSTVVVLVTYGSRLSLLRQALQALDGERAVLHIVIVDNGCPVPLVVDDFRIVHPITIVRSEYNAGSAGGFKLGLECATFVEGAQYILLLDDDNFGSPGFVDQLQQIHALLGGSAKTALCGIRRSRRDYAKWLSCERSEQIWANSFLGFSVTRAPAKMAQVLSRSRGSAKFEGRARIRALQVAPYGGLFIKAEVPRVYGFPDDRLVLYGDDHEFVHRLFKGGVTTYLTDAIWIDDLETSWNERQSVGNTWVAESSPHWRIYFALRNRIFLEKNFVSAPFLYFVNAAIYMAYLFCAAVVARRSFSGVKAAMCPLMDACGDGFSGRLVARAEYRLPDGKIYGSDLRGE